MVVSLSKMLRVLSIQALNDEVGNQSGLNFFAYSIKKIFIKDYNWLYTILGGLMKAKIRNKMIEGG